MNDSYNLERFVRAQSSSYETALLEIQKGKKQSHWMWFIFPQLSGLGFSSMSLKYGIKNIEEARAYLQHELLGKRLVEISRALLAIDNKTIKEIMGEPDDLKLKSCMTLFDEAATFQQVFKQVLQKYYRGEKDHKTLQMLNQ